MTYYNPNQQFQNQPLDPNQFRMMVAGLPDNMLNQLVIRAQLAGINQADIQSGLSVINKFRNQSPYGV